MLAGTDTRAQYDHIGGIYLPIAIGVFAVVVLVLLAFLWRYRARPDDVRTNSRVVDATKTEVVYAVVLVAVTAFLLTVTFRTESREDAITADARADPGALRIDVVAAQWNWRFAYPGRPRVQVISGTEGRREFVVPAGRRILFRGTSQDVVHDFWVPDLRFQRQVWPDHTETWALVFPHPGSYQGLCAWFCGLDHQRMDFTVRAVAPARFATWLAARRREAAA